MVMPSDDVIEKTGWAVFADVFGFRALVEAERAPAGIVHQLRDTHEKVRALLEQETTPPRMFHFSDCLFLFFSVGSATKKYEVLETCVNLTQRVMAEFVENELPLRGGIAYGKVAFAGDLLVGQPIIRAYRYEQVLPAPLLMLPATECTINSASETLHPLAPKGFTQIVLKDNKNALAKLFAPEPIEDFSSLCAQLCRKYSIHGPWELTRPWLEASSYVEQYLRDTR